MKKKKYADIQYRWIASPTGQALRIQAHGPVTNRPYGISEVLRLHEEGDFGYPRVIRKAYTNASEYLPGMGEGTKAYLPAKIRLHEGGKVRIYIPTEPYNRTNGTALYVTGGRGFLKTFLLRMFPKQGVKKSGVQSWKKDKAGIWHLKGTWVDGKLIPPPEPIQSQPWTGEPKPKDIWVEPKWSIPDWVPPKKSFAVHQGSVEKNMEVYGYPYVCCGKAFKTKEEFDAHMEHPNAGDGEIIGVKGGTGRG